MFIWARTLVATAYLVFIGVCAFVYDAGSINDEVTRLGSSLLWASARLGIKIGLAVPLLFYVWIAHGNQLKMIHQLEEAGIKPDAT